MADREVKRIQNYEMPSELYWSLVTSRAYCLDSMPAETRHSLGNIGSHTLSHEEYYTVLSRRRLDFGDWKKPASDNGRVNAFLIQRYKYHVIAPLLRARDSRVTSRCASYATLLHSS